MKTPAVALAILLATAAPAAAQSPADCDAEIKQVVLATFQSGPYEMTSESPTEAGPYISLARVVPGQGMHVRSEVNGKFYDETIVLDGRAWHDAGKGLVEVPVESTAYNSIINPQLFDDDKLVLRPACFGLVEAPGGKYLGYRFGTDTGGVAVDTTLYVDPGTHLTARVETEILGPERTTHSVTTFRYDRAITLKAPAL
jgi:hypothetical protein